MCKHNAKGRSKTNMYRGSHKEQKANKQNREETKTICTGGGGESQRTQKSKQELMRERAGNGSIALISTGSNNCEGLKGRVKVDDFIPAAFFRQWHAPCLRAHSNLTSTHKKQRENKSGVGESRPYTSTQSPFAAA